MSKTVFHDSDGQEETDYIIDNMTFQITYNKSRVQTVVGDDYVFVEGGFFEFSYDFDFRIVTDGIHEIKGYGKGKVKLTQVLQSLNLLNTQSYSLLARRVT